MISRHEIEHIANLARIELTPEEVGEFGQELSQVLEYFKMLERIDTSNIPPMLHSSHSVNVTRGDVARANDKEEGTDLLAAKVQVTVKAHHANA